MIRLSLFISLSSHRKYKEKRIIRRWLCRYKYDKRVYANTKRFIPSQSNPTFGSSHDATLVGYPVPGTVTGTGTGSGTHTYHQPWGAKDSCFLLCIDSVP